MEDFIALIAAVLIWAVLVGLYLTFVGAVIGGLAWVGWSVFSWLVG